MWPLLETNGSRTATAPPHRRFRPAAPADASDAPRSESPVLAPEPSRRGLYAGEPETVRRDVREFLPIWIHLALLGVVATWAYSLEGRAFQILLGIAVAALPVHYLLPLRWKQPAFVAVSMGGMAAVFGVQAALVVLPLAAVLIAIARAPVAWAWRAGAIGAVAVGLALVRAGVVSLPLGLEMPGLVWPVLGTMFMFRMVIYLYELKHARAPEKLGDALAYFFLLPNYAFIHFPVVDYRTFLKGAFATDIHTIQRRGLEMMVRGVVQLLLYRLVYHLLLIPAEEVHNPASFLRFVVCNYLLYLRVSGQFHIACGMLHLFGYQLPETHHHYLLANSFTDYWRRINIYWKDFMVRVVFNPVVFRLKKWPQPRALAVATAVVFVVTWALHAYQSFWLRNHWGFSVPDALFWGILGGLVMVNVQLDARRSRGRRKPAVRGDISRVAAIQALALNGVKTLATLATIALLWSLWSSPTLGAWLGLWNRAFLAAASA
jgi:D-alanyl-lipoteichoic acid acyltransferase DltB (MBOAT superfamily)